MPAYRPGHNPGIIAALQLLYHSASREGKPVREGIKRGFCPLYALLHWHFGPAGTGPIWLRRFRVCLSSFFHDIKQNIIVDIHGFGQTSAVDEHFLLILIVALDCAFLNRGSDKLAGEPVALSYAVEHCLLIDHALFRNQFRDLVDVGSAIVHRHLERAGKPDKDIAVLVRILFGGNHAGWEGRLIQIVVVGGKRNHLVTHRGCDGHGARRPGRASVDVSADHSRNHTIRIHLHDLQIRLGQPFGSEREIEDNLRRSAGCGSDFFAFQVSDRVDALFLVAHNRIRKAGAVDLKDHRFALSAERVCTMADLCDVDVSRSHCRNFGGASLELDQINRNAHLLKEALVACGNQQRCTAHVGHVGYPQLDLLKCFGRLSCRSFARRCRRRGRCRCRGGRGSRRRRRARTAAARKHRSGQYA